MAAVISVRRSGGRVAVEGVAISHPERIVFDDIGATKLDVARYYAAVARWMLPHVVGRPLTLLRCEKPVDPLADKGVVMRHSRAWGPAPLRIVAIQEKRKLGQYLIVDGAPSLVALAQMNVIEIHTWNGRADAPYRHGRVVIDLDPGPEGGLARA